MVLVVGLGNPGKSYESHRHNVGFMAVDALRDSLGAPDFRDKFSAEFSKGDASAILKPLTYMNRSGDSVLPCAAFLKVEPKSIVVVHDELDLPFGDVRLKVGGGHAGHNGLRSIISRLGAPDFVRVRIGIGRPPPEFPGQVADFVLSPFNPSERAELPDVIARAVTAIRDVVEKGVDVAMNVHNTKPKKS